MIVLADVVAEQQVPGALDGGEKYVLVTIVVEIGKHGGAPVTDGINSRDTRDVHEFLALAIHEQSVAFVAAEGEPLLEDQAVLIVAQGAGFLLSIILRHDLTPELASSVVEITPAIVVKINEAPAPRPAA